MSETLASKDIPSEGLVLDRVTVSLKHRVLFRLSLALKPGEIVAVMGPSGSGKSSLLAAICGTLDPAFEMDGRILLDGRPIGAEPPELRRTGILFQDDLLFPHLSVGGNLAFALPPGLSAPERRGRVASALELERDGDEGMNIAVGAYVREDNAH